MVPQIDHWVCSPRNLHFISVYPFVFAEIYLERPQISEIHTGHLATAVVIAGGYEEGESPPSINVRFDFIRRGGILVLMGEGNGLYSIIGRGLNFIS